MSERKSKRNWREEGPPAWVWPSGVTLYALAERILGGFKIGQFYELTTNPNGNWIVPFIGVVMTGFISNKWVKGVNDKDTKSESITVTKESSSPQGSQSPQQP